MSSDLNAAGNVERMLQQNHYESHLVWKLSIRRFPSFFTNANNIEPLNI